MTGPAAAATLERLDGDITGWRWSSGGVTAVFTGREGGVSPAPFDSLNVGANVGDDPANVRENRRRIAEVCGLEPDEVAGVTQVHGADVWVDMAPPGPGRLAPDVCWPAGASPVHADALVTNAQGRGIAVGVADCMPIAISWGDAVGVVHAGWRSLLGGVLEQAVAALRRMGGVAALTEAGAPRAVIGPSLGACCFEVGEEVAARFPSADVSVPAAGGRPHVDARANAVRRLELAGVRVDVIDECTRCGDGWFSHRGDGGTTGRQAVVAWRT